jgi:hypothetical protein
MARRRYSGDPYEILGVGRDADSREIRTAYRRLAKAHHPDVNKAPDAAERMARINWAYSVAMEHARHEGPRVYRGGAHRQQPRTGRPRWFVRQRPPPQGGKLVIVTRSVVLRSQRGENANVEGLVVVENQGTGPLEGEAKATPAYVIVSPKQFQLEAGHTQMFRISVPNRYCGAEPSEVLLHFESNGGDDRVKLGLPAQADVLVALEPSQIDLGELAPGEQRQHRMRLSYRGNGLPRMSVGTADPWLSVQPISLPRRTQYYRLVATAPQELGEHEGRIEARVGDGTAMATVHVTVRLAPVETPDEEQAAEP